MKLSTRGRYGIHAMYDLAVYGQSEPQRLKVIAQRQGMPEAYLEQLISALRKSDLVKSVRGAQGGYLLAREPAQITVGDMLRALEGDLSMVQCLESGDVICDKIEECPARPIWRKLSDGMNQLVDGITLQDMIDDYELTMIQRDGKA